MAKMPTGLNALPKEQCEVTVTYGETVSLGNYEFFRMDRSIKKTVPLEEVDQHSDEILENCKQWVWKKAAIRLQESRPKRNK